MYSISMILPYFTCETGAWPDYIDWHLASCKANETVDFYIFTDDHKIEKWESVKNIHIHYMSFEEFIDLIHTKLGDVKIDRPYKICDYRPAFGVIFEDYIKDFDFWGHYDCDLMYGDIRKYFNEELLSKYDKLYIQGHSQLYKNTEEVNHYYELSRPEGSKYADFNWQKVSSSEKNFGYDEGTGAPMLIRENGKSIYWEMKTFANIHQPRYYKRLFDKDVKVNIPFQLWRWEDGHLYHINALNNKKREVFYIHLTERKMKFIPYENQTSCYINQLSEITDVRKKGDSFTGFGYVVLMTKKIYVWIIWHLTHLTGKKPWEM